MLRRRTVEESWNDGGSTLQEFQVEVEFIASHGELLLRENIPGEQHWERVHDGGATTAPCDWPIIPEQTTVNGTWYPGTVCRWQVPEGEMRRVLSSGRFHYLVDNGIEYDFSFETFLSNDAGSEAGYSIGYQFFEGYRE